MKPRALLYAAARALPVYPAIPARLIGVLTVATLVADYLGAAFTSALLLLTILLAVPVTLAWFAKDVFPAQTTKGIVERKGDRQQRAGGVASVWDVLERASAGAMRRQIPVLRPSLAHLHWWQRKAADVAFLIAQTGPAPGQKLYSGCRDATLRVGGPGTYKTMSLAVLGLDAPGALVTTSTRFDLARHVHQVRSIYPETAPMRRSWKRAWIGKRPVLAEAEERAVHIYNPTGYGNVPSTVRWNILAGCTDYATAQRRAGDLIPESRDSRSEQWERRGRLYLPVLLHAAALSRRNVEDVLRWVELIGLEDKTGDRLSRIRVEITDILAREPGTESEIGLLRAFLSITDVTRGGVTNSMIPALAWVADETAASIGAAPVDTMTLSIPDLINRRETLHIVGPSQEGSFIAPLTSAFVAEIAWQARMLASYMPSERLDPFLTMLLDECAVTVKLPLDRWTADMGGRGVALHMSVQSLSQLEQTWGAAGAGTLKGNVGSLIIFGGGKDADELEMVSKLCGDRWRRVITEDTKILARMAGVQRGEWEKVRVLTAADLMNLDPLQAAVLVRNLGGVFIGRPPIVTDRKGHHQVPVSALIPAPQEPEAALALVPADTAELDVTEESAP
jgi:type IV secretion system protein VirD4